MLRPHLFPAPDGSCYHTFSSLFALTHWSEKSDCHWHHTHSWSHGYHSPSFSSGCQRCRKYSFLFFLPDPVFPPVCPACHSCTAWYFPSVIPVKRDFRSHHIHRHMFRHSEESLPLSGSYCHTCLQSPGYVFSNDIIILSSLFAPANKPFSAHPKTFNIMKPHNNIQ